MIRVDLLLEDELDGLVLRADGALCKSLKQRLLKVDCLLSFNVDVDECMCDEL
jgi:hypothetical protein